LGTKWKAEVAEKERRKGRREIPKAGWWPRAWNGARWGMIFYLLEKISYFTQMTLVRHWDMI